MPDIKASHQGTLRGSVMLPVEPASDGEVGYKTALSEMESDDGSHAGDQPANDEPKHHAKDDEIEVEELPDDYTEQQQKQQQQQQPTLRPPKANLRRKTSKDSPAYVSPIPKIPSIPSVQPIQSSAEAQSTPPPSGEGPLPQQGKMPVHEASKEYLVGKKIDEFGDIVDINGNVLGRVEGDLPSMVGREISNARGDVLGDDGELLGYVAALGAGDDRDKQTRTEVPTWSLAEVMKAMAAAGKGPGGLRVDPFGNILDAEGNNVGSFHDNISGFGKKAAEYAPDSETGEGRTRTKGKKTTGPLEPAAGGEASRQAEDEEAPEAEPSSPKEARRPRENAQSHRKEDPALSPSDIFLDVKSTTEGIQLTIRIPTVFNSAGQPRRPKIVFE
ncbi:hypothetical protein M406DRAFT_106427 [Cryphonectria parasitica EP155]|uniref:Uncharacterized protein n=1 Tax=Cryphonectria parasitica (strain ATCC 38755 / EP155) TaxID=660469 RepID=A0A9P4Y509_CRYP1|nr:uncharacterized protein M406DRAFT_106427 [Cryphonectria parasitica EP155]KAF3767047.1 hypothetical protein M406DRAFT_106427 [Cryphonectria parasitica EP155]